MGSEIIRKMVTIRQIDDIQPIEGADAIEKVIIDGWQVVSQKGIHNIGDLVFYFSIDSFLPTDRPEFDFLKAKEGGKKTVFNGIEGHRLRTIRLRKTLSQGLIISQKHTDVTIFDVNEDYSEQFGVQKWDKPLPAELAGTVRSTFRTDLMPKTDQPRGQEILRDLDIRRFAMPDETFEVTQKLDGSSMTVYAFNGDYGVSSRNMDLIEDDNNTFWKIAKEKEILPWLISQSKFFNNCAIQGELVGEGIQNNAEGIAGKDFFTFDIYDIDAKRYLLPKERRDILPTDFISHVPVIFAEYSLAKDTEGLDRMEMLQKLLDMAEGTNLSGKGKREGIVFKSNIDPHFSFKMIDNNYLLSEKD